ncbi:MAG TPA: sigma-70 family RNA polymerase sigma factor [Solirubrobacteraceae bacterium]
MSTSRSRPAHPSPDADSGGWLDALVGDGAAREEAIAGLHALLLRAAHLELTRRGAADRCDLRELDDLAVQSADDALVAVLAKLDQFRGASRFTTWAYKFAILEAGVKLRRHEWRHRELPLEPEDWSQPRDARPSPPALAEQSELLSAIRGAIETELTPHQREVLVAIALGDVPIDVLCERLGTTRGALYKTIHDARRKLRRRLEADGYPIEAILAG